MKKLRLIWISVLLVATACAFKAATLLPREPYTFNKPDAYYILPDTLHEISGLTDIDDGRIGCVQDEQGMIFIYNLYQSRIEARHTFYLDGDYEGITLVKDNMYVLRSDGMLFRISRFMEGIKQVDSFATHIPNIDNEGLCYDPKANCLLIASKSKLTGQPELKNNRYVYRFDLASHTLDQKPFMVIDITEVEEVMHTRGIELAERKKKNGEYIAGRVKFMPSSIAIHPITGEYFLISATDRLLVTAKQTGEVTNVNLLDQALFPKPEGITFFSNGDLFIANEGKDKKPNLLRFNYRP